MWTNDWMVIGVGVGLICALLVWQDAKRRDMNPWVWSLFVGMILVVGLPMYALLRKPRISDASKKCPDCAEEIKLEATKCRFCGKMFNPADVALQVVESRNNLFSNRVFCPNEGCIGVIGEDGRCKDCGLPYEADG